MHILWSLITDFRVCAWLTISSRMKRNFPCLGCQYFSYVKNNHSVRFIWSCSRRSSKCITNGKKNGGGLWVFLDIFVLFCFLLLILTSIWKDVKYFQTFKIVRSEVRRRLSIKGLFLPLDVWILICMGMVISQTCRLQGLTLPGPRQGHFRVQMHLFFKTVNHWFSKCILQILSVGLRQSVS